MIKASDTLGLADMLERQTKLLIKLGLSNAAKQALDEARHLRLLAALDQKLKPVQSGALTSAYA